MTKVLVATEKPFAKKQSTKLKPSFLMPDMNLLYWKNILKSNHSLMLLKLRTQLLFAVIK